MGIDRGLGEELHSKRLRQQPLEAVHSSTYSSQHSCMRELALYLSPFLGKLTIKTNRGHIAGSRWVQNWEVNLGSHTPVMRFLSVYMFIWKNSQIYCNLTHFRKRGTRWVFQDLETDRSSGVFSLASLFSSLCVIDICKPETEVHGSACPMPPRVLA